MSRRANDEGSVYRLKAGSWVAALNIGHVGGKRKRRAFYGRTRAEVLAKLDKAKQAHRQALPIPPERLTVADLLNTWLETVARPKLRDKSFIRYQGICRLKLMPAIGSVRLTRLEPPDVNRVMADGLKAGASPQSVRHWRAVLRTALAVGVKWGWLSRNVAALSDPPRVPEREIRIIAPADARAILEAVKGDRLDALFSTALALGLRQGESLGLRWGDIDLEAGTLAVQRSLQRVGQEWKFPEPKTVKSRRLIALPRPVVTALREHRARQLQERLRLGAAWQGAEWGDLVFTDEAGGPLSGFHVRRRFNALLKVAGLPPMTYHQLRHACASLLAAMGIPPRTAMEILGHANISTTMNIYAHIGLDAQRDAADAMGAALWGDR